MTDDCGHRVGRERQAWRYAFIVVAAAATLGAACGTKSSIPASGSAQRTIARRLPTTTVHATPTGEQVPRTPAPREHRGAAGAKGQEHARQAPTTPARKKAVSPAQAFARIPETRRNAIVRRVILLTLKVFGLPHATVTVMGGGAVARARVSPVDVCWITAATARKLVGRIHTSVPPLTRVALTAAGQPLAEYVAAHCKAPRLPAGPGRVVYRKRGQGFFTTPQFEIASGAWTVAYESGGGTFQVLVSKDGRYEPEAITARGPAAGTRRFTGPGAVRLSIGASSVAWQIEVRAAR